MASKKVIAVLAVAAVLGAMTVAGAVMPPVQEPAAVTSPVTPPPPGSLEPAPKALHDSDPSRFDEQAAAVGLDDAAARVVAEVKQKIAMSNIPEGGKQMHMEMLDECLEHESIVYRATCVEVTVDNIIWK